MASQGYNEQALLSPKKEGSKLDASIFTEVSPTGIMAFPGIASASGKAVVSRPDTVKLQAPGLDAEETVEHELQRRMEHVSNFWNEAEKELIAGQRDYVIPACENPFGGFGVNEGHVRHMVLKWNLFNESAPEDMTPAASPCPGPNVQKMVYFFDYFAERLIQDEEMEPFVVYKTVSKKIALIVAELEARAVFQPPNVAFDSPVVYRHVSDKIKPLVEFWDALATTGKTGQSIGLEHSSMHKNRRVVVMANLMKKKLDHSTAPTVDNEEMPRKHHNIGPLVLQMVSLLEAMNQQAKTGKTLLETGYAHHVKSLPLVC